MKAEQAKDTPDYWKAVCEADAAWKTYEKFPSDDNWEMWVQAKRDEEAAANPPTGD